MDILQQLVDNSLLTEDSKRVIAEAFEQRINEEKAQVELTIRTQLTEQFVQERDALITALDSKLGDVLTAELTELKESISEFRDLEVEHAEKLVTAKRELAEQVDRDLASLVLIVESFLSEVLASELTELKESIDDARKNVLGAKIFEAFRDQIISIDNPTHKLAEQVRSVTSELEKTKAQLAESKQSADVALRAVALSNLTSTLTGSKKQVMESLLANVPTSQLTEKFNAYVPRLIESAPAEVVTESVQSDDLVVISGDVEQISENVQTRNDSGLTQDQLTYIRTLAGIATK